MQQILDIKYKYIPLEDFYYVSLKILDLQTQESQTITLSNVLKKNSLSFLNFGLSEKKYCTGYFKDNKRLPCLLQKSKSLPAEISGTQTQCPVCEKAQGFKDAFLFGKEPNETAKKYLTQPHFVYLAVFYPNLLKVGTASNVRKFLRPIEQDALVYSYIAQSDGFNIQKLERKISKEFNITEFVQSSHKFKYLSLKLPESSKNIILSTYKSIYSKLSCTDEFKEWFLKENEIKDLREEVYYPKENITYLKNEKNLFGKFLGLRGKYLILENGNYEVALNKDFLTGRLIEGSFDNYEYQVQRDDTISLF